MHTGKINAIPLLTFFILGISCVALAQNPPNSLPETYERQEKLTCGEVQIEVTTRCYAPPEPMSPCLGQRFVFMDLITGKTTTVQNSEGLKGEAFIKGKRLKVMDGWASGWACVKSKGVSYLIVANGTGGTCEDCEWFRIYDLTGKCLTPGRPPLRKYKSTFRKVEKRLDLKDSDYENIQYFRHY